MGRATAARLCLAVRSATFGDARETLRRWLASDVAAGRLLPWIPIAFGLGVVLYFTADREPALWAALGACRRAVGRRNPGARATDSRSRCWSVSRAWRQGFATVTLKSARIAHPILQHAAWDVSISGFVEVREERERADRIVVRVHRIEGRLNDAPERVRLSVKRRMAPPVGTFIR